MGTKKKAAAKPVVKSARTSGNKTAKPVKKAVPVKKAIPVKKVASKKAPVKVVAKKVVKAASKPKNTIVKAAPKKAASVKKNVPPPKVVQAKKQIKPAAKQVKIPAKSAKPVVKQVIKKPAAVKKAAAKAVKPALKPMAKKEEITKPVAKPTGEKAAATSKPAADVKAKDIKVPAPKPVVIPKIATKTVRKYQPDFTKSVLDKTERDPGAPSQRYSDPELLEFKELIQRKLEAAKKELAYLHGLITRKDEMGGDEGDNRYMTMEDGSLSMEREQLSQMASRQITFIDHLEKAIMRIENKTYGICRVTGKLIDKARLRAVPHATLSIEAKMGSVK
ncbi:TraR/DksA C4-type zinc finger protein [Ferruginibacter paludis]|uniref:TraR/DksA family transcriptional regulator n=1 Tax=Ferruginibacter paludis TaxID=1310417 RepID=UPI0025B3F4EC|nr:TraR/DksA C4-type zinc finger protein [Ferruginibacter paludis]MDN3658548.1 TraR/DksA C4-type zinc finger protein [Ferruginibacter paludis]